MWSVADESRDTEKLLLYWASGQLVRVLVYIHLATFGSRLAERASLLGELLLQVARGLTGSIVEE